LKATIITSNILPHYPTDARLSWWAAIEGAVSLLVASLPVIGGRVISRWRHVLTRHTGTHSLNVSKSFRSKHSVHIQQSTHTLHEMDAVEVIPGAYPTGERKIETIVSSGSTLAEDSKDGNSVEEEPVSLIQNMARMGRRGSNSDALADARSSNVITIRKEVYISTEEPSGDSQQQV